jgi:hypothetical protein
MTGDADDALLMRYLVGSCSDEETARVDEQLFANEEMYARLRDVEEQLIERRLGGELSREMQEQFDRAYAVPPRRDRVLFARALKQVLPELKPVAGTGRAWPGLWGRASALPRVLPAWPARLAFAGAALVLVAAIVVSRQQVNELTSSLETAERNNQALRQEREADRDRVAELEKRTAELNEQLQRQGVAPGTPAPSGARGLVATFVLMPGRLRSSRSQTQVSIGATVDRVRLQLELEPDIDYERFNAELRDDESRVLWTERALPRSKGSSGESVVVTFPASFVSSGQYEMVLFGVSDGGTPEDAGHYYFDVRKQP